MYKKIIFILICFCSIFFIGKVFATNDIDYTLTITKDYEFKEVIKYSISDYKKVTNGDNYFSYIISDDVYSDIFGNTKYNKTKSLKNGKYTVILNHTYGEYTMSNANFLNNCFDGEKYTYDMEKIHFKGRGGFNCLYADNLKITIVTDFEVSSTNATVDGNQYIWYPKNNDFMMYITLLKQYEEDPSYADAPTDVEMDEEINGEDISSDDIEGNDDQQEEKEQKKDNKYSYVLMIILGAAGAFVLILAAIVLKQRSNHLNKL